MSQADRDLVAAALAALGEQDLEAMLALTHEEAVLNPLITVWPQPYRGHEGVTEWWGELQSNWEEFGIELEEIRELGDGVLIGLVEWHGTPKGGGTEISGPAAAIVRIEAGKLIGLDMHLDERRALAAFEREAD